MANALERWVGDKRLRPFREVENSLERMFNDMFSSAGRSDFATTPLTDITEDDKNYNINIDLPGCEKDTIKVEVNNDQLTVRAERSEERTEEDKKAKRYLSERYYGSYMRTFTLPGPIDEKRVDAQYQNGVLCIVVPKSDASRAKQIPIH